MLFSSHLLSGMADWRNVAVLSLANLANGTFHHIRKANVSHRGRPVNLGYLNATVM